MKSVRLSGNIAQHHKGNLSYEGQYLAQQAAGSLHSNGSRSNLIHAGGQKQTALQMYEQKILQNKH